MEFIFICPIIVLLTFFNFKFFTSCCWTRKLNEPISTYQNVYLCNMPKIVPGVTALQCHALNLFYSVLKFQQKSGVALEVLITV